MTNKQSDQELKQELQYRLKNNKNLNWDIHYMLLEQYFKNKGNLNIPKSFKTLNGYEYDENGYALGTWLQEIRRSYNLTKLSDNGETNPKLSSDKVILLDRLNMNWNLNDARYIEDYFSKKLNYCKESNLDINKVDDLDIIYKIGLSPNKIDKIMSINAQSIEEDIDIKSDIDVEEEAFKGVLNDKINELLEPLSEKERDIIISHFGLNGHDKMTLGEIADKYNVTGEAIRQIETKLINQFNKPSIRMKFEDFIPVENKNYEFVTKLKEHTLHKYDQLVDFFYPVDVSSISDYQKKTIDSLCYFYLKISKKDFLDIISPYIRKDSIDSQAYYLLDSPLIQLTQIIQEIEEYKFSYETSTSYLDDLPKAGMKK